MSSEETIPYAHLGRQSSQVKPRLLSAVERVIDSGNYILGPEVSHFEAEFAALCSTPYAVGVANGTNSLMLIYRALGIGPGDEIITAPNSFLASASTAVLVGATPVFADIGEDLNIDPSAIEEAITSRTKVLLPVHLTGRPAKMDEILEIGRKYNLLVIEDAAQAVGARYKGKTVGGIADTASFSLHPLKNLYAFGDAGVITTKNQLLYERLKQARNHGFRNRNECDFWSDNCRLDELQAAMLRVQLEELERWTDERRTKAFVYNRELAPYVTVPEEGSDEFCVYQTYVIRAAKRDQLQQFLLEHGVETKIHYPIPIHLQRAAQDLGYSSESFPETLRASTQILSLPCYPTLTDGQQDKVISLVRKFYAG